jgi:hypothetical protein
MARGYRHRARDATPNPATSDDQIHERTCWLARALTMALNAGVRRVLFEGSARAPTVNGYAAAGIPGGQAEILPAKATADAVAQAITGSR